MTCKTAINQVKTETDLQAEIMNMLAWHPKVAFARRRNTGGTYRNGRYIQYGETGDSDIYGMLNDGRYFEIEVKKPGSKTNNEHLKAQAEKIELTIKHGGVAGFARSVMDAKAIIEEEGGSNAA